MGFGELISLFLRKKIDINFHLAVYNRWTGLVDWTSGLDYWTHRFSPETHCNVQNSTNSSSNVVALVQGPCLAPRKFSGWQSSGR